MSASMSAQASLICDPQMSTMDRLNQYDRQWNKDYFHVAVKLGYVCVDEPYDVMEKLTWWQIVNVEEYEEPEDSDSDSDSNSSNMFGELYSSDDED